MAFSKAHPQIKYFSSLQKEGNISAKASKLTIDVPENEEDILSSEILSINKNSPSHSRDTFKAIKIQSNSGTPKNSTPISKQYKPKQIHSEGNIPTGKEKSYNFSPEIKTSSRDPASFYALKKNSSYKIGASTKLNHKSGTPDKSKRLLDLPPRPKMIHNKGYLGKIEIKPETGSSPTLNIHITQIKKSASSSIRIKKQLTEVEIKAMSEVHYKEHLFQTFQAMKLIKNLPPLELSLIREKKIYLPKKVGWENKKTAIFDLDETLVHCCDRTNDCDVILPISFPSGETLAAGINIRPYAVECLREVNKDYEIIIFTASHQSYADAVLDYLDPNKEIIHHRLYRNHCVNAKGIYMKDLRIFANRKIKDIVIIDNSAYSFGNQLDNGVPIISWIDDYYDKELYNLIDYLKTLAKAEDIRDINRQTFHLKTLYEDYIQDFLANDREEAKLVKNSKKG
ncbi:unnamed protein product [Blepharisma stoltei]|uniref:FCP1 homology domain-containing protein n=1 Tax=Blepharisma stoltei TaxID=1481888 RepID=A0AAU9JP38_9CILI|nr:unnamed protein product [Blepharisma stoltei]